MGAEEIVQKDLYPPDQGDENGDIPDFPVPAQVGVQDQYHGRPVDEHRLGAAEGVLMHAGGNYLKGLKDCDPYHEEAAYQAAQQQQYRTPVVAIKTAEKRGPG